MATLPDDAQLSGKAKTIIELFFSFSAIANNLRIPSGIFPPDQNRFGEESSSRRAR